MPLTLDELKAQYEKAPKGVGGYALLKNMGVTWEAIYPLFKKGGVGEELRRKGEVMFNIDQWGKITALRFVKRKEISPSLSRFEPYNTQYSLKQLQEIAKTAGLSPSGLKQDLVNRLIQGGALK